MLAVDVGKEMLRAFRKVENGLEIDNLGACLGDSRERLRKELKVTLVAF